jgi:arginine decarboxylase
MARSSTSEPNRLISSAVGLAVPKDREHYGYISEHHSFGETARKAGDYAEDLAATMLATTLGIAFDPDEAYDSRKQVYKASRYIFTSRNICQSAEGNKHGKWTTVIAAAVMLL